ncbi:unnamed protein product [Toxocara canis]|uniref:Uncharacterized protein n=1 Tax=Toxocara canis TaxID=6265 RepID=A0A183ULK0_TOXCA|nr:unnamed protein product [Toxocara canis]
MDGSIGRCVVGLGTTEQRSVSANQVIQFATPNGFGVSLKLLANQVQLPHPSHIPVHNKRLDYNNACSETSFDFFQEKPFTVCRNHTKYEC